MRRLTVVALSLMLFTLGLCSLSTPAPAQIAVGISVGFGPPALPVYEQPICPGEGYIWTPGYWAWDEDDEDYYWVPGTWVLAPEVGYLWTPPWWGWEGGRYLFHVGYWGPHIGFYGGVNYGFGYFGEGFVGGRWDHDHFFYNRSVTNINVVNIHNVYNENVHINENRVSYNGGPGGIDRRPRPEEEAAARDRHIAPIAAQTEHIQQARGNRELRASVNQGRPSIAATGRPGQFSGHEVVQAREAGAPYHPPANRGGGAPHNENRPPENNARPPENGGGNRTFGHAKELPPIERGNPPNTGNAKQDQKYQQQQQKLYDKQNQERQKLQQQQEREHQQAQQRNYNQARQQQMEQRHQQQTQQLQQRHQQQTQQMQQRQAPPPPRGGHR